MSIMQTLPEELFHATSDEMRRIIRDECLREMLDHPNVNPLQALNILQSQSQELDKFVDLCKAQQETLEQLSELPRPVATLLIIEKDQDDQPLGRIAFRGTQYQARFHPDQDVATFQESDQVIITPEANVILQRCEHWVPVGGALGMFQRRLRGRQLELSLPGDARISVLAASPLDIDDLQPGDTVEYQESDKIAFNAYPVERHFSFNNTIERRLSTQEIYPEFYQRAYAAIAMPLRDPGVAQDYLLPNSGSMIFYGPPGTGKSTLAEMLAGDLQAEFGDRVCWKSVSTADIYDQYFGVAEQRIKQLFEDAREAGRNGVCLLIFDEGEGLSRQRGELAGGHRDSTLSVLLNETGKANLGNVWLLVITNRPDQMDSAFKDRTRRMHFAFGRLTMAQVRGMLGCHLPSICRYAVNGKPAEHLREEMLDRAVELLFAETLLGHAVLNTGERHAIYPRDLLTGRMLENTCVAARNAAAERQTNGGEAGLRMSDIEKAVSDTIAGLSEISMNEVRERLQSDLKHGAQIVDIHMLKQSAPSQKWSQADCLAQD